VRRVAVFGLGIAGRETARALTNRGYGVRLGDDVVTDDMSTFADDIDAPLYSLSDPGSLEQLLRYVDTVIPAPGVPPHHRVIEVAKKLRIDIRTEIDVAYEWEQQRPGGPRPMLGVTGTDGKTTTTMLTASLLRGGGLRAAEVGNTDVPLIAALDDDHDVFVVECSSFRLQYVSQFRCVASTWLNFAPDHLDWHPNMEHYAQAKARLWSHVQAGDVAIVPADNALIRGYAHASGAKVVTFGLSAADYGVVDGKLTSPHGDLAAVDALWRSMPHDITNALAASALVLESGLMSPETIGASLSKFEPAHHRIELVGEFEGSRWFDDSKATSPHASLTAIRAFERIVLIAGGRNKGLDLTEMATEPHRMVGVVAIGDDADDIRGAFSDVCPVSVASSMKEAVAMARQFVSPGVDVLLSPGCTSFDWYNNYGERGDDFQLKVREHFVESSSLRSTSETETGEVSS
jgi:UDP-N-acetylmuramoylalanine--D-glutamate ligase